MTTDRQTQPHPFALTTAQIAQFDEHGYLLVKGLLPADTIQALRERFAFVVDRFAEAWLAAGLVDDTCKDEPFETRWAALRSRLPPKITQSWRSILVSPEVYNLWQEPALVGAMRSLIGDELYAHGTWNGRPREPGSWDLQRVTWHQDAAYYPEWDADEGRLVTCWVPLVPVSAETGCLQVVPDSHRLGYIPFERSANGARAVPKDVVANISPFTGEMKPGDVLMFAATTLHQALDNRSDYVRWSIDIRYGPANEAIMAKGGPGYRCFSATDPSQVESFDSWAERYQAERRAEADTRAAELKELSTTLGVSSLELEAF